MATTGDRIAGTGTSVTRGSGTAWTNPGNITANDGTTASVSSGSFGSNYLVASNFGFTVPTGSVIQGVTVKFEAAESSTGTESVTAQLQDNSAALFGTTIAQTVNGTTLTVYTYGGTANLWGTGTALTPEVVNDPDFGVRFWFTTTHNMTVDYVSIAIEYLPPVSGSLSVSETGSDTFTSTGEVIVEGSLSSSEAGSDTFSASGTVFTPAATGSLAATEVGADTFTSTGKVIVEGALAATEAGADTFAATGDVIVQGALAASETGGDTFASTGKVVVGGVLAASETGADTFASTGKVVVSGALSASETGADAFDSQGSVTGALVGDLHVTEQGSDSFASSGQVKVQGALAANEANDTLSATGDVLVQGVLSASETGADEFDSQGDTIGALVGDLHGFESGSDIASASGKVLVRGTLAGNEVGADTFAGIGVVQYDPGTLAAQEQGNDTAAASGKVLVKGGLSAAEAADALSAAGDVLVQGSLGATDRPDTANFTNIKPVEVAATAGGGRNIGFRPVAEVTVKLKVSQPAKTGVAKARAQLSAYVVATNVGAIAGEPKVTVYRSGRPNTRVTRSGTVRPNVHVGYAFTTPVQPSSGAGTAQTIIVPRIEQYLVADVQRRAVIRTSDARVRTVINPSDDEVMAIISLLRQKRQRRFQSFYRS